MKNLICLIFLVVTVSLFGQQQPTISPQVINTAGDHRQVGNTGVWITDNVGEPFTETISNGNVMITQGFIQPEVKNDRVTILFSGLTCMDRDDGQIRVSYVPAVPTS